MSRRLSGIDPELGLDALEQLERREERRAALRAVEEQVEDPPGVDPRRVEEAVLSTDFDCDCEYVSDPPIVFVAVAGGKTMASSSGTVVPETMSGRMSLGSILVNTYSGAKGYAFSNWKRAVKQLLEHERPKSDKAVYSATTQLTQIEGTITPYSKAAAWMKWVRLSLIHI